MASQKPIIYKKGTNILLESRRSPSPTKHSPSHCVIKSRSISTNTDPDYKCKNCMKSQSSTTSNSQMKSQMSFGNYSQNSIDPSWVNYFNSTNGPMPAEITKFEEVDNSKVENDMEMKKGYSENCNENCHNKSFTMNPYPFMGNLQHITSVPQNAGNSPVLPVFIPIYVSNPVVLNQDSLSKIESQTKCDRCCRKSPVRVTTSQTTADYFSSEDEKETIKRGMKRVDKKSLISVPAKIKNSQAKTDVSTDEGESSSKKLEKNKLEQLRQEKYGAVKRETTTHGINLSDHMKMNKNNEICYKDLTSKIKQTKPGKKLSDDSLRANKCNLTGIKKTDNSTEEFSDNTAVLSSAEIDEHDTQDDNVHMSQQEILNRLIAPSTKIFNNVELTRRRESTFIEDNIGAYENFKHNEDNLSESQKQHLFDLNHNENNDQQEFNDAHSDRSQESKADTVCDVTKQNAFTLLSFEEDAGKTFGKHSKEKIITMLSFLTQQANTDNRNLNDLLAQITNTTIHEEKFEELPLNDEPNSSHKIVHTEKPKMEIIGEKDHLGNLLPQSGTRKKSPPPYSKLRANSPTFFH